MSNTYTLAAATRGTLHPSYGPPVEFEYEAGDHVPASACEAEVFAHLVSVGAADIKPKRTKGA